MSGILKRSWLCGVLVLAALPLAPADLADGDAAALRAGALDALANLVLAPQGADEPLRDEAVGLLGRYGSSAYTAVILRRLEAVPSGAGAVTAIRALGELRDPTVLPSLQAVFTGPEVHRSEEDLRWSVAAAAGDALLKFGQAGLDLVLEAARGPDAQLRRRAVQALARATNLAPKGFFAGFVHDTDRWVRLDVAAILGRLSDAAAVPALKELLDDADRDVRIEAAKSLARLGDPSGSALLLQLVALDPDDGLALRLLARLSPSEHLAALITHLDKPVSDDELDDVAALLSTCPRDQIVPALEAACGSDSAPSRANAAALLGRLKEPNALPTLTELLKDPTWDVRAEAVRALGSMRLKAALPSVRSLAALIAPLGESAQTRAAREACAIALARLGDRDGAAQLCLVGVGKTERLGVSPEVAAQVGGEALERVLIEAIKEPNAGRPVQGLLDELRALECLGSRAAAPTIEALLRERPYARTTALDLPEVWAGLLDALAGCAGPAAAGAAAAYANDETPLVLLAACHAILRLTTKDITED
jgi:HEAT repeat protein